MAFAADLVDVRVLVVEDDPESLEVLRTVLEDAGARVTAAPNAREALSQVGPFDVIVSDIGMPETDGFTMLQRVRAKGTTTPAIALTAYAGKGDADRALRAGFQEHVAKPIDTARLLDTVRRWSRLARKGG